MKIFCHYLISVILALIDLAFCLWQDRSGFPVLVSGVPPDAFSETGQLWGRFRFLALFFN